MAAIGLGAVGSGESIESPASEPMAATQPVSRPEGSEDSRTNDIRVAFDHSGRVGEILVQAGDTVRRGSILAVRARDESGQDDTAALRAALAKAESDLQAARTHYLNKLQQREIGRPAADDEENARLAMEDALRRRNEAVQEVTRSYVEENRLRLRSPVDGRVESVLVESNQWVEAGQPVMSVRRDEEATANGYE